MKVDPEIVSTTHHTFLVGPWPNAPAGSVHVVEQDGPDDVVLILKPVDVVPFVTALLMAHAGQSVKVDVTDLRGNQDHRLTPPKYGRPVRETHENEHGDFAQ